MTPPEGKLEVLARAEMRVSGTTSLTWEPRRLRGIFMRKRQQRWHVDQPVWGMNLDAMTQA